ncbi:MAG: hypothetical protein KAS93_07300 [Gammaproteobacteria bacterium]|nr:hypothetical protein [Gammaproteobacteria bacterium]
MKKSAQNLTSLFCISALAILFHTANGYAASCTKPQASKPSPTKQLNTTGKIKLEPAHIWAFSIKQAHSANAKITSIAKTPNKYYVTFNNIKEMSVDITNSEFAASTTPKKVLENLWPKKPISGTFVGLITINSPKKHTLLVTAEKPNYSVKNNTLSMIMTIHDNDQFAKEHNNKTVTIKPILLRLWVSGPEALKTDWERLGFPPPKCKMQGNSWWCPDTLKTAHNINCITKKDRQLA